ncbi:MAG: hypothetical protein HC806_09515 [Anaerolineae bacterium]|nr:hypothetical protein [Anaerolineae bacterium]
MPWPLFGSGRRIDDPRDVLFLFAALSTGLAIGVYGFTISFVGSILFCIVATLLHFSPFKSYAHHSNLYFTLSDDLQLAEILKVVQSHCRDTRVVTILVNKENALRYHYAISLKRDGSKEDLIQALRNFEGIKQIKISTNDIIAG